MDYDLMKSANIFGVYDVLALFIKENNKTPALSELIILNLM